jgi:translation initiation factor 2B subunit (eIF-2B alpha/beta/delta family)
MTSDDIALLRQGCLPLSRASLETFIQEYKKLEKLNKNIKEKIEKCIKCEPSCVACRNTIDLLQSLYKTKE